MANLRIAELDFDTIKSNLKDFLKNYTDTDGAPYFTDFDFEGSGLSILLDVLSYNTHYNAYLASMVINDMFLDSAVKRASAVSIAKHLGYTPISAIGARATISFTVTDVTNSPNFLTLDKFTPFTTFANESTLTFVNLDAKTIQPVNGIYSFEDIEIVEGIPLQYVYSVETPGPLEKYTIPNDNVDTTTIQVVVQNSVSDSTQTVYTLTEDTLNIDGESTVFFIEENPSGLYQIYFGDGVIGKKLARNNLITINYLITNGTIGNVAGTLSQQFTCGTSIGGGTVSGTIIAATNSRGGLEREDINSIKFRAPKFSSSSNRAVTGEDYKAIISKNYPLVQSVSVWGGEDNVPPMYGKVIISLNPYEGYAITEGVKADIKNIILQNKQVLSIMPEFVDPDYFYINLSVNVKYEAAKTSLSSTNIKNLVVNEIQNYFSTDLQKFDKDFVFSKLSRNIDNVNEYVIGNLMTVKLQRRITPILNSKLNIYTLGDTINFKNGLVPGSLTSTSFAVNYKGNSLVAKIKDVPNDSVPNNTGTGTIQLIDASNDDLLNTAYGSINYGTGELSIDNLELIGYPADTSDIRITATVQDEYLDITVNKNQIILLDDSSTNIDSNRLPGLTVNVISV
jgi:hypothetical protein